MKLNKPLFTAYVVSPFIIPFLISLLIGCTKTYKNIDELRKVGVHSDKLIFLMSDINVCHANDMDYRIEKEWGSSLFKVICHGKNPGVTVYRSDYEYKEEKEEE